MDVVDLPCCRMELGMPLLTWPANPEVLCAYSAVRGESWAFVRFSARFESCNLRRVSCCRAASVTTFGRKCSDQQTNRCERRVSYVRRCEGYQPILTSLRCAYAKDNVEHSGFSVSQTHPFKKANEKDVGDGGHGRRLLLRLQVLLVLL